jgi:diadenylate cyclase
VVEFTRFWSDLLGELDGAFNTIGFSDILDWLVVAFLIYQGVLLVRETRAMQLVKGIAAILIVYLFAYVSRMPALSFILRAVINSGVLLIAVLFQPELRRALEQVGRNKLLPEIGGRLGLMAGGQREERERVIAAVCDSCAYLAEKKMGALIVIERETKLGEIINTGTVIEARPSVELITNIFFKNSPMHDGAMVIRGDTIHAAGCYLPMSANTEIGRELGTRHRAALGMSEVSDAVVVVVSEETGFISVAVDSRLQRRLSVQNLGKFLNAKVLGKTPESGDKPALRGFWGIKKK